MSGTNILERLNSGERLILDGATKTELRRRGVTDTEKSKGNLRKGISYKPTTANLDAPEKVRELHSDYLRAGADIISTNTFNSSRSKILLRGMAHLVDRVEELNRLAVQIAKDSRVGVNPGAYIAGSIPPPLAEIDDAQKAVDVADQGKNLADSGVDLILLEYIGSIEECVRAVKAVSNLGLPVFLGIRKVTPEGTMFSGESFRDLALSIAGQRVDAILLMCSRSNDISACLPLLRNAYAGPTGAYPNVERDAGYTPADHARYAKEWFSMGAQIVGGCCGTSPEHIAALRPPASGV